MSQRDVHFIKRLSYKTRAAIQTSFLFILVSFRETIEKELL